MSDRNLLSFAGDDKGNIYHNGALLFSADVPGMREISVGEIIPDRTIADSLKLSGCVRLKVVADYIQGGAEDVVDINHCADCEVSIKRAEPRGKYVATIKGGSRNIRVSVEAQEGHGKETDFDLGNWADQNKGVRTTGVSIAARCADGSPVRVRVLHAWKPALEGGGRYEMNTLYKGAFYVVFSFLKRIGARFGLAL